MVAHLVQDTGKHCTLFFINMRDRELRGRGKETKSVIKEWRGGGEWREKSLNQEISNQQSGREDPAMRFLVHSII